MVLLLITRLLLMAPVLQVLLVLLPPPRPLPVLRLLVMALVLPVQTTAASAIPCGPSGARATSSKKRSARCASS
jgi:hypothetical protein